MNKTFYTRIIFFDKNKNIIDFDFYSEDANELIESYKEDKMFQEQLIRLAKNNITDEAVSIYLPFTQKGKKHFGRNIVGLVRDTSLNEKALYPNSIPFLSNLPQLAYDNPNSCFVFGTKWQN